jgi:uncharacterized protein (TIGR03067 family)
MKKPLPARPNLDHLRTQAKQLLARLRLDDEEAARTFIEHLPAARKMTPDQVRRAGFRLADAQSAVARKSGFAAWPALAHHVELLRALEGEWRFESLEVDGRQMPTAMSGNARMLIDGDRFRMESIEANYEGVFTIDVEAEPAHIDIQFVEGPEAGNWSYGIFRLDGDEMLLCLGLVGAERPATFTTTAGSGHALERMRRSSSARPAGVTGGRRRTAVAAPVTTPPAPVDTRGFELAMTPLLEQLQGEWAPISLVTNGSPLAESTLPFGSRTITGNETQVVFGGQVMLHARMRFDESQSPIALDYLNVGRGAKGVTLGVIELRGDVLRICMATAGGSRPHDFSCERGSGRTFSEWTRKPSPRM